RHTRFSRDWSSDVCSSDLKPPKEILDLVEYERPPGVLMDSDKNYMILTYRSTYKSLDDLNQEELRLGGLRINPNHHISSTITYRSEERRVGKECRSAVRRE